MPQVGADKPPENGKHVEYYENGNKKSEVHYKNGKMDGLYAMWWRNGQKKLEIHFKNGKANDLMTEWDKDGKKTLEIQYNNDVEVSRKEFQQS